MIQLTHLSLQRGSKQLLEDVNLVIYAQQKIGIVGENGAGKSSLFALLRGLLTSDVGDIFVPPHLRIAHLEQEIPALSQAALEYIIDGDQELRAIEKALTETEDGLQIAELHMRMGAIDGYSAKARAAQLMYGLGFTAEEQSQSVSAFSGGWRMRLNLAKTLMCRSDLLLLDEPTNHLDLDAILWLETWLKSYTGTLLFISHDRDFLDSIASHIIHLEHKQLKIYTGNYSDFEKQRVAQLELQQATYEKQQRQRAYLQSFIDRFKAKASKARQAQSRIKALARMEIIQAAHVDSPFTFSFREASACSNPLFKLDKANIGYGDKIILKNISISLTAQDRIGLIGPNGAGKSTLIKCLAGELSPLSSEYFMNPALKIGYFTQHQLDNLDLQASPLLHLQRLSPQETEQKLRTYLGSFGFMGDQALAKVEPFSGGEKARLALALLIWQKPNLLLLDEPTNHLDLEMRQALTMALQDYQGAMIVVSHDRHLLRSCTDSLILVAHQKAQEFAGDLDEYQTWLNNYRRDIQTPPKTENTHNKLQQQSNKQQRALESKIKKLEEEIATLQKQKETIDKKLAANDLYEEKQHEKLKQLLQEQEILIQKIAALEEDWFSLQG